MPIKSSDKQPGIVVHVCNPRTRETEAGRSQTPGPIGLYREYKARLGCRAEAMSQNDKQESINAIDKLLLILHFLFFGTRFYCIYIGLELTL